MTTTKTVVVRNPHILGGEPTIAGTRVPVRSVVVLFGMYRDVAIVHESLPTLPPGGVEAALAFYDEHAAEIDQYIRENNEVDDDLAERRTTVS